jgi:integrase
MRDSNATGTGGAASYSVRIFDVRMREGKRGRAYDVRWSVDGRQRSRTFKTRALADGFRAELLSASRRGEPFDVATGIARSMLATERDDLAWFDFACTFTDAKWKRAAPRYRQGIAEALATATPALLRSERGRPSPRLLRRALNEWAFNTARRAAGPPPSDLAEVVGWVRHNTLPVSALGDTRTARAVLDALAYRLDGLPAAAKTVARKRATIFNALEYAVELGHLDGNPLGRIKWSPPKATDAVDRRSVVNHAQARALLDAVAKQGETGRQLVAFFGCMYYAAMRPAEVTALAIENVLLPEGEGWGDFQLGHSSPAVNSGWTDSGRRETRQLKHRARKEVRQVPCCPPLVQLLRAHLAEFGTAPDGRLFRAVRSGGPVSDSVYGRTWQKARTAALSAADARSPLARRPYDLRHAAVSTWLNAGVPATQVAEWAGHSVHVLLRVYAKCIVGQDEAARRRIEDAMRNSDDPGESPGTNKRQVE